MFRFIKQTIIIGLIRILITIILSKAGGRTALLNKVIVLTGNGRRQQLTTPFIPFKLNKNK